MTETALERVIRKVQTKFPVGSRVKLTEYAASMFPRRKGVTGTIIGYHNQVGPKVRWDGLKTPDSWTPDYLRRVSPPHPTETEGRI